MGTRWVRGLRPEAGLVLVLALGCGGDGTSGSPLLPCEPGITLGVDTHTSIPGWSAAIRGEYPPGFVTIAAHPGLSSKDVAPGTHWHEEFEPLIRCTFHLLVGTNDAGIPTLRRSSEVFANVDSLIADLIYWHNVERVIVSMPPEVTAEGPFVPVVNRLLEEYRDDFYEICEHDPDDRIDCGADLWRDLRPYHMAGDGVHLNTDGHARVFELVLPLLDGE